MTTDARFVCCIFIQVSVRGIEHNEQGSRERRHATVGPGAHQVFGKGPGLVERRESLQRPHAAVPEQPHIVVVHVRPFVGRIRVALRVGHGARQDRSRVRTPATRGRLVLGNPPEVSPIA